MSLTKTKFGAALPAGFRLEISPEVPVRKQYQDIVETAQHMEKLGFDSCWVYDHFCPWPIVKSDHSLFEAWTVLAALSQVTSRIRIGTVVTSAFYRNPALLAKMATTVDIASNGRLDFGIGAGWDQEESEAYGYKFASAGERVTTMIESVRIIKKLWTANGGATFDGKFVKIKDAYLYPKPVQKPYPPILIGGGGERILKFAAKEADAINLDSPTLEQTSEKLKMIESHCKAVGADYNRLKKSAHLFLFLSKEEQEAKKSARKIYDVYENAGKNSSHESFEQYQFSRIVGTPKQAVDRLRAYKKLGISHFIFWIPEIVNHEALDLLASQVIPNLD